VKVKIGRDWGFRQVVEAAWKAYVGIGLDSRGRRNSVLMAWASVVGRERAMMEFDNFIASHEGSFERAATTIDFSARSLKKVRKHIASLPSSVPRSPPPTLRRYVLGERLDGDEDRLVEYKEIKGSNPVDAIKNAADEYAVAFLNSSGGRMFWGVRDGDRVVVGVPLAYADRDKIRQIVTNKLSGIKPQIDPTSFRLEFHEVFDGGSPVPDLSVVELVIPESGGSTLFWTEGDETFVMLDGVKKRLQGPQIEAFIRSRNGAG
jgi:Putative DNA-binding domain